MSPLTIMNNNQDIQNAIFVILWELAKLDEKPIQIGNTTFDPSMVDRGMDRSGVDYDRLQVAISKLESEAPSQDAKQFFNEGKKNLAREVFRFHYCWFRSMRDCMWDKLFLLMNRDAIDPPVTPVGPGNHTEDSDRLHAYWLANQKELEPRILTRDGRKEVASKMYSAVFGPNVEENLWRKVTRFVYGRTPEEIRQSRMRGVREGSKRQKRALNHR